MQNAFCPVPPAGSDANSPRDHTERIASVVEKSSSPPVTVEEAAALEKLRERRELIRRLATAAAVPVVVAAISGAPRSADAGSGP